jgi:outer membrane protein
VCFIGWVFAASIVAEEDRFKVGYVNLDRVAELSRTIRQTADRLESELRAQQEIIEQKREEYKRTEAALEVQATILTSQQVEERKKTLRALASEIDNLEYELSRALRKSEKEFIQPTFDKIMKAIENIGKEEGYDLIIRSDAVLYGNRVHDLTPRIILQLDTMGDDRPTSPPVEKEAKRQ